MAIVKNFRPVVALASAVLALAAGAVPASAWAGIGSIGYADLSGNWTATLSGFTGCGPTALHVAISMNSVGVGTATVTQHGQCGNSVVFGQSFKILTLNTTGTGTANLTCGPGCGWNLRLQVAPNRETMNLVDVDPLNPNNSIAGVALHY